MYRSISGVIGVDWIVYVINMRSNRKNLPGNTSGHTELQHGTFMSIELLEEWLDVGKERWKERWNVAK